MKENSIMHINEFVSVIVPVYNTDEKYIGECLDSIIAQSYQYLEIIIVDDGSKGNIALFLDEYKKCDARIKVYHQNNKGLSAARNAGINQSSGKYIVHVDSDDVLCKTFVETGVELLQRSDADIAIFGHHKLINNTVMPSGYSGPFRLEFDANNMYKLIGLAVCDRFIEDVFFPYNMCAWGKIFLAESIKRCNIQFRNVGLAEDQDYVTRLYPKLRKVVFENKPLYIYRQDNDSLTRGVKPNIVEDRCAIFDILERNIDKNNPKLNEAFDNGRAQYLVNVCTTYLFHPMCKENYTYKRYYMKNALKQRHFIEGLCGLKKCYFPLSKYIYLLLLKWNMIDAALLIGWCGAKKKYK